MATREELEAREDVKAIIDTLKADPKLTGKRLRPIESVIGLLVVQNPSMGQANVMMAQLHDDDKSIAAKALPGLFKMCIVYPPQAELQAALEPLPLALTEPSTMLEFRRHIGNAKEADAK